MRGITFFLLIVLGLNAYQPNIILAKDAEPMIHRPNILMVVIDTCRADHFSVYGYKRLTTPNIDNLARQSILFKSAYAQTNWTLVSFASLLTGKYPRSIGMFEANRRLSDFPYIDPRLSEAEITLPEVLKKAGYRTAGFFTGGFNDSIYGFNQGFDLYRNYKSNSDAKKEPRKSFSTFLPEAFKWMKENKDAPFFILLNPIEPHRPYLPADSFIKLYAENYTGIMALSWLSKGLLTSIKKDNEGWNCSLDNLTTDGGLSGKTKLLSPGEPVVRISQADIDYLIARYDASVAYADKFIGEIIEWIQKTISDNTIIIITADHGEGLGDHGSFLHCTDPPRLYQEIIHVPLIIKIPKKWLNTKNAILNQPVELVDLMPTILDLVGIPEPLSKGVQGKSLVGIIMGEEKEEVNRAVFAETLGYGFNVQSIKEGDWKLIHTKSVDRAASKIELYNLSTDPYETRNLTLQKPRVVKRLLGQLNIWVNNNGK